jgi:hypothetical protein
MSKAMANKQVTAVEWAFEKISNIDWKHLSDSDRNDLFTQALQMEREQIEQAYGDGLNAHRTDFCNRVEYYNQTYAD